MEEELNNYYTDIFFQEKNDYSTIYNATEISSGKNVILKILDKRLIEEGPKDLLLKQIKREEELTKECKCDNVVELHKFLKTNLSYTFVYEFCDTNFADYMKENGPLDNNQKLFYKLVFSLAEILKVLNKKKVIHRDIKPNNIYIKLIDIESEKKIEENCIIKLGDFGSSIKREENDSIQIGTMLYLPPEMLENIDYDEKCDMWSLGITLYHLYMGYPPYGLEYDFESIQDKLYSDNFIFKFSDIPTLDILFKKLLEINPKDRMGHEEFYEYIHSKEFMHPKAIYKKEVYGKIYNEIEKIKQTNEYKNINIEETENESHNATKIKENELKEITKIAPSFDIVIPHKKEKEKQNKEKNIEYVNIIYYNEEKDKRYEKEIKKEIDRFEEQTTGTFFFIKDFISFQLIIEEIYKIVITDSRYVFDLIVTGKACEKIMKCLIENNDKYQICIRHICIFCMNIKEYSPLKAKYNKIVEIYKSKTKLINDFIKENAKKNKDIKPFPVNKFITYEEYQNEYFKSHFKISLFYGHQSQESYLDNLEKLKKRIREDNDHLILKEDKLIKAFETFDFKKDVENVNKNIIKEYSRNTFYGDLNRWLRNLNKYSYEEIAYFTSRFMLSLNDYAIEYQKYINENNKKLFRGTKMPLSSLLAYERAKGQIISLTSFTSMTTEEKIANKFARIRKNPKINKIQNEFSVIYHVINFHKDNWISNGVDIHEISRYPKEKEVLFQPFSFYVIKDVKIYIEERKARIDLETIGKKEILEKAIQGGKHVKYNKDLNIIESF